MFVTIQKTIPTTDAIAMYIGFEKDVLKTGFIKLNIFNFSLVLFFLS
jgi:hypothetical protein